MSKVISVVGVEEKIFFVRGKRVLFDRDLAVLYGVRTKELNKAVARNRARFPQDFMFRLTAQELENLRFQFGTSSWGGLRYAPYAFTEQGIAMLSSVLRSKRAIDVNIAIMRAFLKLREVLATHKELADRLNELEGRMDRKDQEVMSLFEAIRKLMEPPPPEKPKGKMGFI